MADGKREESGTGRPVALITGASSGIGEAFARRLARDGHDLVLVARRKDRLEAIADRLQKEQDTGVEVMQADLADEEQLARVEEKVGTTDRLACLVNNAGLMVPTKFVDSEVDVWDVMVRVHALAPMRLAHAAVPGMVSRGRGDIINVASIAAFIPAANSVIYCATKVFLSSFSEGLWRELRGTGVHVQCLCPGWTRTGLVADPNVDTSAIWNAWWMDVEDVVDYSLRCLKRRKLVCIPGWRNRALVRLCRAIPRALLRWAVRHTRMNQVFMKGE